MNSTKSMRLWLCTGLIVLVSMSALPSRANPFPPAGAWVGYPANFYGYGGDFLDVAKFVFSFQDFLTSNQFPIAVAHASPYIVKSQNGIGNPVTITSADQVHEFYGYDGVMIPFAARATMDDSPAYQNDSNYRSQKGWAIFMAAQVIFVCDNATIPGPVSLVGGSTTTTTNVADSLTQMRICSDGTWPVYVSAAYAHGIGPQ